VGAQHGHLLHYHAHSPVHSLPAHLKVLALLAFVVVVVATPGEYYLAFAAYLALVGAAARFASVPWGYLLPRLVIEVPFLVFALLLPFIATGPRIELGPLTVSEPGLFAAWTLLAKGTLGVLAALLLAATTEPASVVGGLHRLRLPTAMVLILSFMVRYVEVVATEMRRMTVARRSRGFAERSVRSWPVLARTAGALFIRSYERGERVHLAMLSRGFDGELSLETEQEAGRAQMAQAASLPLTAAVVLVAALTWGPVFA